MLLGEPGADEVLIAALRISVNDRVGLTVSVQRKRTVLATSASLIPSRAAFSRSTVTLTPDSFLPDSVQYPLVQELLHDLLDMGDDVSCFVEVIAINFRIQRPFESRSS